MKHDYEKIFFRLVYSLKECSNTTLILGAGCSLSSSKNDISFRSLMEKSLLEHDIYNAKEYDWNKLYKEFINIVWEGKGKKEREHLLKKIFVDLTPSTGYMYLRALVEKGYINNIITTNVDMLLEKCFEGLSYRKRVGNNDYILVGNQPTFDLIKVHGDIENGELRFSPDELMKLPDDLQKDIYEKTAGLVIVAGYKGQDHGLMNSLNTSNEYAAYWTDLNELDICDFYTIKPIIKFMSSRNASNNFLHGNEYGDFDNLLKNLHSFIILTNNSSSIIRSKEHLVGQEWKNTTIVDMLKLYNRLYKLFLELLEISKKEQEKLCGNIIPSNDIYYNEFLHSYLYFFNKQKLPLSLLQIPNNELDTLILAVSLDIKVKSVYYNLDSDELIDKVRESFRTLDNSPLINNEFWCAVKNVICNDKVDYMHIVVNMCNKLEIISHESPIGELNELIRVIDFLSLFIPSQKREVKEVSSLHRIKQLLSDKYEKITFNENKLLINLGEMDFEDAELIKKIYFEDLPDIRKPIKKNFGKKEWTILESKWIELQLISNFEANLFEPQAGSLSNRYIEKAALSTHNFLNLAKPFETKANGYINLQIDNDIRNFIKSDLSAMFIIGTSGRGKTIALQHFVHENQENNSNIITLIVTPKNSIIKKFGLELFLDLKITEQNTKTILKFINSSLELSEKKLILIFDGLNEISNIYEIQESHYIEFLDLAKNIYYEKCNKIKLIITCRESVYYRYKASTNLQLNPLYFFYNKELQDNEIHDFAYKISPLSLFEKQKLMQNYGLTNKIIFSSNNLYDLYNYIIENDITPLFIAIVGETLKSSSGIRMLKKGENIYNIFTNLMLSRLDHNDVYLTQKIIYIYFELLIKYRKSDIEVTEFKILDNLPFEYHKDFGTMILKMQDVNIFVADSSKYKRIKFAHDQIEEFFFKQYIVEFENSELLFFDKVVELCEKNIIYKRGFLQYFKHLINENKLLRLKELSLSLAIRNFNLVPNILIEAISSTENIRQVLGFLLDENDRENSKKMFSLIILGIENCIFSFSTLNFDLEKLIDDLLTYSHKINSEANLSNLNYFKSKIFYFKGDYNNSLELIENARLLCPVNDRMLLAIINIHNAIIFMEQGYSKKSVELLEKEFNYFLSIDDFAKVVETGTELGRAKYHCGQTTSVLKLYDSLLNDDREIENLYVISKLYERKANVLNKVMYHMLQYGIHTTDSVSSETLNQVEILFNEAVELYRKSIELLRKINDMFTYSGVIPEFINTYVSYSISVSKKGINDCKNMIIEMDKLFEHLSTPFQVDYYLSKAYYYEYLKDIVTAESSIEKGLLTAKKLCIKNKIAKCNSFYAYFAYRCLQKYPENSQKFDWLNLGIERLNEAILYYNENTIIKDNIVLEDALILKEKYQNLINIY